MCTNQAAVDLQDQGMGFLTRELELYTLDLLYFGWLLGSISAILYIRIAAVFD